LFNRLTILQNGHGAEFQDLERLAVESVTRLAKYDRPRRVEFYRDRNYSQEGEQRNQSRTSQENVDCPLD
jgi:hypothetical protein